MIINFKQNIRMKAKMNTRTRCRYVRPELWVIPCAIPPIMGPSIHARGTNWTQGGTEDLNFNGGGTISPTQNFGFKSVWDASVTELQDGKLVVIPGDE